MTGRQEDRTVFELCPCAPDPVSRLDRRVENETPGTLRPSFDRHNGIGPRRQRTACIDPNPSLEYVRPNRRHVDAVASRNSESVDFCHVRTRDRERGMDGGCEDPSHAVVDR
ncbi:MAG: hypothetical protein ABFC89_09720 [Methanospirillum sp.]